MLTFELAKQICVEPYKLMPPQPFQLTERSFRRYETAILAFVTNYPKPTQFNPHPLSPNTYAARLRDAIRSLELYKWTTVIDVEKLKSIRDKVVVRIDSKSGNIVVCSKEEGLEAVSTTPIPFETKKPHAARTLTSINDAELMALVLLLHNRRIDAVKITGQLSAHVQLVINGYDVEFIEEDDGGIILL